MRSANFVLDIFADDANSTYPFLRAAVAYSALHS